MNGDKLNWARIQLTRLSSSSKCLADFFFKREAIPKEKLIF